MHPMTEPFQKRQNGIQTEEQNYNVILVSFLRQSSHFPGVLLANLLKMVFSLSKGSKIAQGHVMQAEEHHTVLFAALQ